MAKNTENKKKNAKTIPFIYTDKNKKTLKKLKSIDFPFNREGKMSFCDYRIKCWEAKKIEYSKTPSTLEKKEAKVKSLKDKITALEVEIAADKK